MRIVQNLFRRPMYHKTRLGNHFTAFGNRTSFMFSTHSSNEQDNDGSKNKLVVPVEQPPSTLTSQTDVVDTSSNPIKKWLLRFDYLRTHHQRIRKYRKDIEAISTNKLSQFAQDVDLRKSVEVNLFSETIANTAAAKREEYDKQLAQSTQNRSTQFIDEIERLQDEKQNAFEEDMASFTRDKVYQFSQETQLVVEEKKQVLEKDLSHLTHESVEKFSEKIHQNVNREQAKFQKSIDQTKEKASKEFTTYMQQLAEQKQGELTVEIKKETTTQTKNFSQKLDDISGLQQDSFSNDLHRIQDSKKGEFSNTIQATMEEKKEIFTQELKDQSGKEFDQFSNKMEIMSDAKVQSFENKLAESVQKKTQAFSENIEEIEKQSKKLNESIDKEREELQKSLLQIKENTSAEFSTHLQKVSEKKIEELKVDINKEAIACSEKLLSSMQVISGQQSQNFQNTIHQLTNSQENEFSGTIQTTLEKKKEIFNQSLKDDTQRQVTGFSNAISNLSDEKKKEYSRQITDVREKEVKTFSQAMGEMELKSQEQINTATKKRMDELVKELDDKNKQKIFHYEGQIKLEEEKLEKQIKELGKKVEEKATKDFRSKANKYFVFIFFMLIAMIGTYASSKIVELLIRKKALESLDKFLGLEPQDLSSKRREEIAKLIKDFENWMRGYSVNILKNIPGSRIEIQKMLWVAQLLLLHSEPVLSNLALDQNLRFREINDAAVYLTKGIAQFQSRNYTNAMEAFKTAHEKAQSDPIMKARIYIAEARLFKEIQELDSAIRSLKNAKDGLANLPNNPATKPIRSIVLRDLGFLKLEKETIISQGLKEDLERDFLEVTRTRDEKDLLHKQCKIGLQIVKQRYCNKNATKDEIAKITEESTALLNTELKEVDPTKVFTYLVLLQKELKDKVLNFNPAAFGVITDYEYALMSDRSYHPGNTWENDKETNRQLRNKTWEIFKVSNHLKRLGDIGFGAHAFYNRSANEMVIAFRGTKEGKNIRTDLMAWLWSGRDIVFSAALEFLQDVQEEMGKKGIAGPIKLVLTGHSLGAWLAECTLWQIRHDPSKVKKFRDIEAVTFDSPGSANLIDTQKRHVPWRQIKGSDLPLTAYLAPPNVINTSAQHVGMAIELPIRYQVVPLTWWFKILSHLTDETVEMRALRQILETLHTHRLQIFLTCFDPDSGNLIENKGIPREIKSWPIGWREQSIYSRIAEKAGGDTNQIEWNLIDQHDLAQEANYRTNTLDLYRAKRTDFPPKVWDYLIRYLKTNGESDPAADPRALRYKIDSEIIISSVLPIRQLARYVEIRNARKPGDEKEVSFVKDQSIFGKIRTDLRLQKLSTQDSSERNEFYIGL